ncbi:hypothetical protein PIB30_090101, partial [Stylosanthes scabra]|nr:hypothetical protein [Stylosanthes scabra]
MTVLGGASHPPSNGVSPTNRERICLWPLGTSESHEFIECCGHIEMREEEVSKSEGRAVGHVTRIELFSNPYSNCWYEDDDDVHGYLEFEDHFFDTRKSTKIHTTEEPKSGTCSPSIDLKEQEADLISELPSQSAISDSEEHPGSPKASSYSPPIKIE